jgi:hypothetical protein
VLGLASPGYETLHLHHGRRPKDIQKVFLLATLLRWIKSTGGSSLKDFARCYVEHSLNLL